MSLLSQASLVVVPSGYKEDVVYSVKPTDGSGDLTFTRASDGTRVNSQGLVERVPWNLVKSSGDISTQSTYWASNQGGSTTQNAAVAPDGTTTAAQITSNGATFSGVSQSSISVSAVPYTYSCYLKATSGTPTIRLTFYDGVTFHQGNFPITSEWVRYSFTFTPVAGTFAIYNTCTSVATWLAWGAQLNEGTLKPYFPTTDRLNVPRLDYSNGCPSLLLEPQRTNLVTYSEQFDNAIWAKANTSVTANSAISPDGTQNADTVANTGTNNVPELYQYYALASGSTAYTLSCYMKANTHTKGILRAYNGGTTTTPLVLFDLSAGTVIASYGNATNPTITNVGNGWYRCSMTFTTVASPVGIFPHITNLSNTYTYQSSFNYVENYNNIGSIYIWGAQLEASSYPTSYIPTTSASVTRVADAAQLLGMASGVADGATSATLLLELECINESANDAFCFGQSSSFYPPGRGYIYNKSNGFADSFGGGGFTIPENENVKMIFRLNSLSSTNIFQNGVKGPTRTGTAWSQIEQIAIRGAYASMKVKQMVFFPTALTDAECIALTS